MSIRKPYSQLSLAIDLIQCEYPIRNPILIAEKLEEVLGLEYSIHQISDYLDMETLRKLKKINKINKSKKHVKSIRIV
jgi:hypothetical protein